MAINEHQLIITRKPSGNYTIDLYVPSTFAGGPSSDLVTTVGAAKGSPIAQCIRLLERLLGLADKLAGYNQ